MAKDSSGSSACGKLFGFQFRAILEISSHFTNCTILVHDRGNSTLSIQLANAKAMRVGPTIDIMWLSSVTL